MKLVHTILWLCLPVCLFAQKLNTPSDLKTLVHQSDLQYEYTSEAIPDLDTEFPMIGAGLFVVQENGEQQVLNYRETESKFVKSQRNKAIKFLQKKEYVKARAELSKALEAMPSHSGLMTLMGRTYQYENTPDQALSWYKKSTTVNYIDYEAYLEIARSLIEKEEYETAFKAALFAKALNRNNPRVQETLQKVALLNGMAYKDWSFVPKMKIENESNTVKISYEGEAWKAYAMSEAVWENEPEYAKTKAAKNEQELDMIRYKESLLNGVIAYELMKYADPKVQYPEMEAFSVAIGESLADEYIYYEIISLKDPYCISSMSKDDLDQIVQYLLLAHFDKMPVKYAVK